RHGHDAEAMLTDHQADPFLGSNHLRRVLDADPDVCVSFLRPGAMFAPWRNDYPSLVLVSSHPRLLDMSEFPWSDRELVVITDPDFAPAYQKLGLEPVLRPLATNLPDPAALEASNAPACDACVVGNLPSAEDTLQALPGDLSARFETQADRWAHDPSLQAQELLSEIGIHDDPDDVLVRALAYEATARRRVLAAVALAEAGHSVRIHGGPEWTRRIAGTAAEGCWHGPLDPELEMPAAFRAATVSINVNSYATPNMLNMRSFDVPAAGGVLLCDDRPALHQAFEVTQEAMAFDRIETLPDLVADLVANPDRRDAISRAGRDRVEREHSWDAWWRWAESALRERFGS
ncbi:MAG: glycosyltransferase, partial [Phycisphaerales bacterium]|nr:glycosyltransferase [Phycisphaerales bacterium]